MFEKCDAACGGDSVYFQSHFMVTLKMLRSDVLWNINDQLRQKVQASRSRYERRWRPNPSRFDLCSSLWHSKTDIGLRLYSLIM